MQILIPLFQEIRLGIKVRRLRVVGQARTAFKFFLSIHNCHGLIISSRSFEMEMGIP